MADVVWLVAPTGRRAHAVASFPGDVGVVRAFCGFKISRARFRNDHVGFRVARTTAHCPKCAPLAEKHEQRGARAAELSAEREVTS